jgi:LacI family transcriptional regulator
MSYRITLRQVADYAGVSVTTVSNVIRGWPHIAESTRARVQEAIDTLGYSPHPIAQGLRTGRTQTIALIVPDLAKPHFAAMVSTIEQIAREQAYSILIYNSHDDEDSEISSIHESIKRWVDGMIIVHAADARMTTALLSSLTIPVVALDRVPSDFDGPACQIDNRLAARLALEHLYALGHRRIAYLAGPPSAATARERLEGYEAWLHDRGMEYRAVAECAGEWDADTGYLSMRRILDNSPIPTAVFASNDLIAIGALHALHERGFVVPRDMAVIGVDDIELCRHTHPPLTTIAQPLEQMARSSISMLLRLIRNETLEQTRVLLPPQLIIRETTAPVRVA